MVNNNTSKNTSTTTVVASESSIYLKKSELPKNLSSFRNDVGYISSTALDIWMKEHSYLSKDEITELIRKANLVVIDTVNRSYDDDAVARLNEDIVSIKGEIVAIKDRLNTMDGDFISSDKEGSFATIGDIRNITNRINNVENSVNNISIDTSHLAEKSDIPTKVSELENDTNYLTSHQSLSGYVKKTDLNTYAKKTDLDGYVKTSDIPSTEGLATQKWVKDQGYLNEHQSLAKYAKKSDLPDMSQYIKADDVVIPVIEDMATKTWVEGKGYLTEHQSLAKYALKKDIPDTSKFITLEDINIPSVDGLASKDWVNGQGYLKEHQSLAKYAKKSDLPDMSQYLKADDIVIPVIEDMATKTWVEDQKYLKEHQSLAKYAKKSDLPDTSQFITRDEIPSTEGLASKDWVNSQGFLTQHQSLAKYAKKTDIPSLDGLATEAWVLDQIPEDMDMSKYAEKSQLDGYVKTNTLNKYAKKSDVTSMMDGYATQEWVNSQGFITELGDMSGYALKTDIPSLSGYATQAWVKNNYLKKGSVYEKSEADSKFLKTSDASNTFVSKSDADEKYISKNDVKKEYLKIEDYRGLREMTNNYEVFKDAVVINDEYKDLTYNQFNTSNILNDINNGFYIVDESNENILCIVKDHTIIGSIKDGTQKQLMWELDD